jgi:Mg2+ and Co2+ transporter CorA
MAKRKDQIEIRSTIASLVLSIYATTEKLVSDSNLYLKICEIWHEEHLAQ